VLGIIFGIIFRRLHGLSERCGRADRFGVHSNCRAGDRSVQAVRESTILENNIVQTIGSAGESMPAASFHPCRR